MAQKDVSDLISDAIAELQDHVARMAVEPAEHNLETWST
jgi:hypothetical protein